LDSLAAVLFSVTDEFCQEIIKVRCLATMHRRYTAETTFGRKTRDKIA